MKTDVILFISAGLIKPKKEGNPFAEYHTYLNYGLLGLATILFKKGYNPILYHGHFLEPKSFCNLVIEDSNFSPTYPIFLSLPSVFAINWAKEFICEFKLKYPKVKIIVGGRWVVENDGKWIRSVLPHIDLVVYGTAEKRIESLLIPENWSSISNTDASNIHIPENSIFEYPIYNYELLYDYKRFNPSIEVSRGCGLGCSFCLEKDAPLQKIKSSDLILQEIGGIQSLYKMDSITPYFESSFFRPSSKWAKLFAQQYEEGSYSFQWRSETRIDSLSEEILTLLVGGGLKVLDIGLESASIKQLNRMNKSTKPEIYLERASKFLAICNKLGIWTKVNILMYAGETFDTINETINWLDKHKQFIKGISVNPLTVYGRDANTLQYINQLKQYGAAPVDDNFFFKGYTNMHLSKEFTYDVSEEYRIKISKLFMSSDDYFDLKSFSYFPKEFSRNLFNEICNLSEVSKLPFDLVKEME